MKIGLLKEEKIPSDERVVLTPKQCKWIAENTNVDIVVKSSDVRCFLDSDYSNLGIEVVNDLSDCDVLLGVKEVPKEQLISDKIYFYFSHTIKEQSYNRELLQRMVQKNITMVDYEVLKDKNNKRLIGFGRYAGIVGAYNALLTYGLKSDKFFLKAANKCSGINEVHQELNKIKLSSEKIILTGKGRVANGALEILRKANVTEVSKEEFVTKTFKESVFCRLDTMDYNERIDGTLYDKYDFYNNPEKYKSSFMNYTKHADIFIAGHFYGVDSPYLFTREDAKSEYFNLQVVADISCDINGPVASTIRPSTIENPIYGYNPKTESEDDFKKGGVIAVMAVDNLPCELPKDASEYFGNEFVNEILPFLIGEDPDKVLERATICKGGNLTSDFRYLKAYLNGN
ncbi:MAG TPA: NAD(P)-dependent oxidoreductase [Flavobacteriales bacterium]|nr:NAD(P)-dependent oxidoreductase [Flavobacteriales bacterium]